MTTDRVVAEARPLALTLDSRISYSAPRARPVTVERCDVVSVGSDGPANQVVLFRLRYSTFVVDASSVVHPTEMELDVDDVLTPLITGAVVSDGVGVGAGSAGVGPARRLFTF